MQKIVGDEEGVSILLEYLILMGIMAVFVAVMSLQLHETLTESQVVRVVENQFADISSQISAIYTDYILLLPPEGVITTELQMPYSIAGIQYNAELGVMDPNVALIKLESIGGKFPLVAYIGLGYKKFYTKHGTIDLQVEGETLGGENAVLRYDSTRKCPFIPKIRVEFDPRSVEYGGVTTMKVGFENAEEISKPVDWKVQLWNGTEITGNAVSTEQRIRISDVIGCNLRAGSTHDYECTALAIAWISELQHCNSTFNQILLVSTRPEESNPYIVYEKWVEPNLVAPGQEFEVHLRLEGRGFFVEGVANLSVVHVIDVSGSMIWPTIFKNFSLNVNPNVIREEINLTQNGKLEIYAYTTSKLPSWYNSSMCKCSGTGCPSGYDSSLIRLYLNGQEVGSAYTSGSAVGKRYTNNNAQAGNYTIEVVAAAPEQIDITLRVVFRNNEILNKTVPYLNRQEVSFELPSGVSYKFLAISGIQNLPNWDMNYRNVDEWSSWNRIESYTVSGQARYWDYGWRQCGDRTNTFQQGSLNVWLILPYGSKEFLMKGENQPWYQGRNNYRTNGINADAFIVNPSPGEYKFVVVPTTKNPTTFTATALIKRIDAAKLAGITFNSMLGEKDFVGIANFSTDGQRIAVNSSPLRFMTTDKSYVNSIINQQRAELATDHADGLYYGSRIFPIWNEAGNNCTDCIAGTRPLIIMLTDGEPTICNRGTNYYGCNLCNQDCSGGSWCEPCKNQALCIANYLKNSVKINDFNISICTIGFSTDIGGRGQQFLREMASPRPDTGEPCYFFATTSDELVEAYKTIFNAFQIAAKSIIVKETLNVSLNSPFRLISVRAISSTGQVLNPTVRELADKTEVNIDISSIQKDEVIELIIRLKAKDDAPLGEYDINDDNNSFITYTALDNRGNEIGSVTLPIKSNRDKVKISLGGGGSIILR